jgi:hypothetical protein
MSSRIYLENEDNFLKISDPNLGKMVSEDLRDLIDLFVGLPAQSIWTRKDGKEFFTRFSSAESYEFFDKGELENFLMEKWGGYFIMPYQISKKESKILLRVHLVPVEIDMIGYESNRKRKMRISKIENILR